MDTPEELKKWFVKMGYRGKLPTDLTPVCNASTVCLWKEVMNKVKPRDEITRIRNNIIINYFNKSSTSEEDLNCKHEIKEIKVWEQRRKLEKQVVFIKSQIQSTENKIRDLEQHNKMKHLRLDELGDKIKQHRKYIYLLKSKSKDLENQLCNIKDMLQTSISLTPIESDNEDEAKVLDLLKQCTGKLEEIVQNEQEKTNSF